jgi:ubiquinone/menaquinone biosynthesis C-methylase UbiE
MNNYLEQSKKAWECASEFSPDKESVYPAHGFVQQFDQVRNKNVYEYACGGGSDVMSYLRRDNYVTASDIVQANLDTTLWRVKTMLPEKVKDLNLVLLQDSYPLPFEDDSFDVISSHGCLHHIIEADKVMKELYRVCKPGGSIYIMLYTEILLEHHWPRMEQMMLTRGISKEEAFCICTDGEGTPYARSYTTQEGCDFLEDNGFQVIDFTPWLNDWFCTYVGVK